MIITAAHFLNQCFPTITHLSSLSINPFEMKKKQQPSFSFFCGQVSESNLSDVTKSEVSHRWWTAQKNALRRAHNYPCLSACLNCLIAPFLLLRSNSCCRRYHLIDYIVRTFFKFSNPTSNLSEVDMNRVDPELTLGLLISRSGCKNDPCFNTPMAQKTSKKSRLSPDDHRNRNRIWTYFWRTTKINFNCRCFMENYSTHKSFWAKA